MELYAEHGCFGGRQGFYRHDSREIGLPMKFSVFVPPIARVAESVTTQVRGRDFVGPQAAREALEAMVAGRADPREGWMLAL